MRAASRRGRAASWDRVQSWLGGVPTAAWLCALVACLSAIGWSFVTPPFQAPDEQAHFAYVEVLTRTGHLPSSSTQEYALDEVQALEDLEVGRVSFEPEQRTIATASAQRKLDGDLARTRTIFPPGVRAAGDAASEPPLYYALEAVPYVLGTGGGVLVQLALMRLVSALMAGFTTLFVFLFLREALPSTPRAWTLAGLGVAFLPVLGFISGAVNPDSMLCAISAAIFYCLARAFRCGLTAGLAIAIGALAGAGSLTKLDFLGLVPGIVLGLVLLAKRSSQTLGTRTAARVLVCALAVASVPGCLYILINTLSHHQTVGLVSGVIARTSHHSLLGEVSYIWQLYLPRLPGMHTDFADISPIRYLWFDGLVGDYGFEDTWFPGWVDGIAAIPALAIAALSAREVFARSSVLRGRAGELAVYLAMAAGLLTVIGATSYLSFPAEAASFPEPRYLLPLIPIFGGALALAVRGAGRRAGAAVGALIVVLFFAHDLFSQLQVIARYYG
jgi:4-amino-4-deoxy-L-arabinose transferase-like glycosyltransferase